MAQKRKRFGDRKDGRRLRTIAPMSMLEPFIMKDRNDALNYMNEKIDVSHIQKYINNKKKEGLQGFSFMYVLLAAYVRGISQRPAVNRFISGQRVYARNKIEIAITIKEEMSIDSPDTVIKVTLPPDATVYDVYEAFEKEIRNYRENPNSDFDDVAKTLAKLPRPILRLVMKFLYFLDYHGWLPDSLLQVSPFHASLVITSMGSLGVPAIYHHLYNFGNAPLFIAFGKKYFENKIFDDGSVKKKAYVDLKFVMDERICDGYYFASAFKLMKSILKNPEQLDEKPETVVEDID